MKNIKTNSGILLVGIGNTNKGDDGLGWRFVEEVESSGYDYFDMELRSRLRAEDATLVSEYEIVIFVVAVEENLSEGFEVRTGFASGNAFFSKQVQAPGAILFLCNTLYGKFPKAYIVAISGEAWEPEAFLSKVAQKNLQAALGYFIEQLLPVLPVTETAW